MCVSGGMTDNQDEVWCATNFLNAVALRLAVVIRAELLEVMQRIELPVSPPAFGCQDNCTNVKRALISGFFLKVRQVEYLVCACVKMFHCHITTEWHSEHTERERE